MGKIQVKVDRLRLISGRYFWRPTESVKALGFVAEALGKDLATAISRATELNAQVSIARGETPAKIMSGSIAALIRDFRSSPEWRRLAPKTQKGYSAILDEIERTAGHGLATKVTRKGLVKTYRKLLTRGVPIAAAHMRVWSVLLGHGYNIGWLEENHARRMKLIIPKHRTRVWTPDEVARFIAAADAEKRPCIALAVQLAYDIGQRQGDIIRLPWAAWDGECFALAQRKTGRRVRVPICDPALTDHLNELAERKTSTQIIVATATKRPYREDHFRHEFARIRKVAGLPDDLQFRDLRRTAATELGDAGATDDELRGVTGHLSRGVVAIYVTPTTTQASHGQDKRRLARNKTGA